MRKCLHFSMMLFIIVLLAGCGTKEKMVCRKSQTIGTVELKQTVEYTFEDGYALDSKSTIEAEFNDEESAKNFSESYKEKEDCKVELDGKKVKVIRTEAVSDDSKKAKANKKETVREDTESKDFICEQFIFCLIC